MKDTALQSVSGLHMRKRKGRKARHLFISVFQLFPYIFMLPPLMPVCLILPQLVFLFWGADGQENNFARFDKHVAHICEFYRSQRDAFMESADRHLTDLAEWNCPQAGMFVWLKLLGVTDTFELITKHAVEQKVLLVPGRAFVPNNGL